MRGEEGITTTTPMPTRALPTVVTGVTPKGVFMRVLGPLVEGLLIRGQQRVDVGDTLQVKLVSTDPQRGYIDFTR